MAKLYCTILLLITSTFCSGGESVWHAQTLNSERVQLPSAPVIALRLKEALGQRFDDYIKKNPSLISNFANKKMPAEHIVSNVALSVFGYKDDKERKAIQSAVLDVLTQNSLVANTYMQTNNYMTQKRYSTKSKKVNR